MHEAKIKYKYFFKITFILQCLSNMFTIFLHYFMNYSDIIICSTKLQNVIENSARIVKKCREVNRVM